MILLHNPSSEQKALMLANEVVNIKGGHVLALNHETGFQFDKGTKVNYRMIPTKESSSISLKFLIEYVNYFKNDNFITVTDVPYLFVHFKLKQNGNNFDQANALASMIQNLVEAISHPNVLMLLPIVLDQNSNFVANGIAPFIQHNLISITPRVQLFSPAFEDLIAFRDDVSLKDYGLNTIAMTNKKTFPDNITRLESYSEMAKVLLK